MNSVFAGQDQAFAKQSLQLIIDSLGRSEVPCEFTFQVWKKGEYETNSDAPGGPVAPKNPGLRPGRHGPDYGGFETPGGPGVRLDRMRGTLGRV